MSQAPKSKYAFGVTNTLTPSAQKDTAPKDNTAAETTSSNVVAETGKVLEKGTIEYRVRQQLEAQRSKRAVGEQGPKTQDAMKDGIIDAAINQIRRYYEEELRQQVYAECEPTVGAWKTIVQESLRQEMKADVEKSMVAEARRAMEEDWASAKWQKLRADIEAEREKLRAEMRAKMAEEMEAEKEKMKEEERAKMAEEIKTQLRGEEYEKMYEAEKEKMGHSVRAELKAKAIKELKRELAHPVRKEMRKKLAKVYATAMAQADSDTESEKEDDNGLQATGAAAATVVDDPTPVGQSGLPQEHSSSHDANELVDYDDLEEGAPVIDQSSINREKHWETLLGPGLDTGSSPAISKRRAPPRSAESFFGGDLFEVDVVGDPSLNPSSKRKADDSSDAESEEASNRPKRIRTTPPATGYGMPSIEEEGPSHSPTSAEGSPEQPRSGYLDASFLEEVSQSPEIKEEEEEEEEEEMDPVLRQALAARDAERTPSDDDEEPVFGIGADGVYGQIAPVVGRSDDNGGDGGEGGEDDEDGEGGETHAPQETEVGQETQPQGAQRRTRRARSQPGPDFQPRRSARLQTPGRH
ncbi:MAG: hypothetical protein Q9191_007438 [Dirinaria sp. TL-2023a]